MIPWEKDPTWDTTHLPEKENEPIMSKLFTRQFWKDTAERAVSTAAQAAILVIGADAINIVTVDWPEVAGFAAGGAALTVLKALAVGAKDGSPSAVNASQPSGRYAAD